MEEGIFFALAAGLTWGVSPVLIKRGLKSSDVSTAVILQQGSAVATLLAVLAGSPDGYTGMPAKAAATFVLVGVVGGYFGRIFLLKGIDEVGASKAQSISNTAPLLTTFFAAVLLGEVLTQKIFFGVVLIASGLVLVTQGGPGNRSSRGANWRGFLNPLLSALFFGLGPVLKKIAVNQGGPAVFGALITHLSGFVCILFFGRLLRIRWTGNKIPIQSGLYFVASGLLQAIGSIFTYIAVIHAPAMIVAPIWNIQPLVTFSLSHLTLRGLEVATLKDGLGAAVIVIGVFLLYRA